MPDGAQVTFDPRLTPARPDLAAKHLEGKVTAARFVAGEEREIIDAQAPVRQTPAPDAPLLTEALLGERVTVYEFNEEGWAWGQLAADGYVGWMPANALMPPRQAPTHKVTALRTLAFPGSSIKLPPVSMPPLGARVAVVREQERFAIAPFGFIPLNHLAPLQVYESDFVAVAQRFVGTPYLWGGKTNQGIDCSGLVQIALTACGVACPRDSDMQERALGDVVVPNDDLSDLQRGDLLFWPGHVAIVTRAQMLLHANAFHMAVMAEPLAQAIQRIAASGIPLRAIKRLAQSHGGQR